MSPMSPKLIAAALFAAVLLAVHPAAAVDQKPSRATYDQTKSFVDEAVALYRRVGAQQAFKAFNDPKGRWVRGDLYIFAFDLKGVYMATGYRPERTGTNAWAMKDAAGAPVVQEILRAANAKGNALVDYLWTNPVSGLVENKTSYVVKVDKYVIGAGFYHR